MIKLACPERVTVAMAADLLAIPLSRMNKYIKDGKISVTKDPFTLPNGITVHRRMISRADLEFFAASNNIGVQEDLRYEF